jgi:hypothetical protein
MHSRTMKTIAGAAAVVALAALAAGRTGVTAAVADEGPVLQSVGPLTFGPDGLLFAADTTAATIYALDLGAQATGGKAGAADVDGIDQKIAAMLGSDATAIRVTDLAIHPRTKNAYISVMRGTGADAKPVLLRVDGDGKIEPIAIAKLKYTRATLPNAPVANETARRNPRADSVTDMAFSNGKLIVAGLSNEEFASKLRSFAYPFTAADPGTSVEIFHGNHGAVETRSPVYAFVPYTIGGTKQIVAGYLCTPLVTFPMTSLTAAPAGKVRGTTIAELGSGNRPIDMIVYSRGGQDYLLMSNTSRGVMKIPTATFATAPGITTKVPEGTAGVPFETLAELKGVEHLDRVGADKVAVLTKADTGVSLRTIALP